ncbi:uncharacterized protein MONBRDRAFT_8499 [Monosiga brevicollis MX1]|uniref:Aldose 1-epimerase n=1 Tax=Monosiga brevicollis TaxID=81824 RepID=A9V079_MONBE|nr:uncharacterized protein MONBRDRAFT_8499 [Monosiga brevicollis MX1]EDQ88964.1 predicted protein [Monosiga brevicollis MX1]|eukprot:XP_001746069.1 hypothetical protein [Monosiga brevicollis MX1]
MAQVEKAEYGKLSETGETVHIYTLTGAQGLVVKIMDYGATIVSLLAPDESGAKADVVLGFATLADWETKNVPYFGAVIGRVANRIAKGEMEVDGKTYTLAINNGPNHLHGGLRGFDKQVWQSEIVENGVRFSLISPDGQENYPGECKVQVTYTVSEDNKLTLSYEFEVDKRCPVNITNHAYFNLAGAASGSVRDHKLTMPSTHVTEAIELIPTGKLLPVEIERGYDVNFVVQREDDSGLCLAAEYVSAAMSPFTSMPVFCFVWAFRLRLRDNPHMECGRGIAWLIPNRDVACGASRLPYNPYQAFCLETQHFPDSVHRPEFPTVLREAGRKYTSQTVYEFYATSSDATSAKKAKTRTSLSQERRTLCLLFSGHQGVPCQLSYLQRKPVTGVYLKPTDDERTGQCMSAKAG